MKEKVKKAAKKVQAKGKGIFKKYNDASAKMKVGPTAMKTAVEAGLVSGGGAGIAALIGRFSPLVGVAIIAAGNILGDKTKLSMIAGASMIGYGIAKSKYFEAEAKKAEAKKELDGFSLGIVKDQAKNRLIDFKESWMKAFFLDKLIKPKEDKGAGNNTGESIGAIDLSALDVFEDFNRQQAIKFESDRVLQEDQSFIDTSDEIDDNFNELSQFDREENGLENDLEGVEMFSMIDEGIIDFSTF